MPRTLNRRTKLYDKGTFSKNSSKFAYDAEESEALDSLATLSYDVVWLVNSNVLATSVPRHVPQYVHDSVSNASHIPAVNYLNPSFQWKSKRLCKANNKPNSRDILHVEESDCCSCEVGTNAILLAV